MSFGVIAIFYLFLQRYEKLSKEQKKSRNICDTQLCLVPLQHYTIKALTFIVYLACKIMATRML